jgi:ribosomal protein L37AE/L43A
MSEHVCECCGEPATRRDRDGVWLCEADFQHLLGHADDSDMDDGNWQYCIIGDEWGMYG